RGTPPAPAGPSPRPLPAPGVYLYDTEGSFEVALFGGSKHRYPDRTTVTLTHTPCGADMRWDVLEERWERAVLCSAGDGIEVREFVTFHEFYEQGMTRHFRCRAPTFLHPPTTDAGSSFGGRCASPDAAAEIAGTVVGVEDMTVAGRPVASLRVRTEETLTGAVQGWRRSEIWFARSNGLMLKRVSRTQARASTPGGPTDYTEKFTMSISALDPLR
ncbi:MAG TPA: hypothetical protein VM840_12325, partial [Actinomycetota bacterium]|nr:hypothetical protein [Actinomycetota bacterium]